MKRMLLHPLKNKSGVALIFAVLLFTAAAVATVVILSLGVKVKSMNKEGETLTRLEEIRKALQNYYLVHYDLPDPSITTPVNSVPVVALNLPQRYRFDSNGQMVRYDRLPASGAITTVRNIMVHGSGAENLVAAVLVAPGPDKVIASGNLAEPYNAEASDDLVVAVSLEAEALKVAYHAVSILQQTALAYDAIFARKNNDLDTRYYEPQTRWVDITQPTLVMEWVQIDTDADGNPVYGWRATGDYHPNYGGGELITYNPDGTTSLTPIPDGDEYVAPYPLRRPVAIIDEDGAVPAEGGGGEGCVRIAEVDSGLMWSNDPSRGVWSLDNCSSGRPAYDLAVAYGLNLAKLGLGYYGGILTLLDPWGYPYLWGTAAFPTSNPRYWSFYSIGPDGVNNTADDILPAADRLPR